MKNGFAKEILTTRNFSIEKLNAQTNIGISIMHSSLGKTCDERHKCPTELFRNRNTVTFYYRGHQTVMHLNLTLRIQ